MSETGSDEYAPEAAQIERKIVMLAVDSSLESRGAIMWAARSLINPGDEVLIFHAIKALKEIPTAMGMVPFKGASPEMQRAHMIGAEQDANKMVEMHAMYCKSQKIEPKTEVIWGSRREVILEKIEERRITHLVMGTGKANRRLSFLRKESLTVGVTREAKCQVFLVGKDGKLASRSSYNPDASGRPQLRPASAPERLTRLEAEVASPLAPSPPPLNYQNSGSTSSASSTIYPGSEVDESETPHSIAYPPVFRATPPGTPRSLGGDPSSPVTVLVKEFGPRTNPLQRTTSMPSPLAKIPTPPNTPPKASRGAASKRSSILREGTTNPLFRNPPQKPFQPLPPEAFQSMPSYPTWEEQSKLTPKPVAPSSESGSAFTMGGDDASSDGGGEELEALRAQVRQLRLVSAMRAREAARYAEQLEVKETEAVAVGRQLAEESRRRKAAERTASRLVSVLGEAAPERVVDIVSSGFDADFRD